MWFLFVVAHNCCCTADHLAKRGLPKPKESPLCDQEEEKYQSPPYFLCLCWTILVYLWSLVGESMKQPVVWSNVGSTLWSYWALGSYGTTGTVVFLMVWFLLFVKPWSWKEKSVDFGLWQGLEESFSWLSPWPCLECCFLDGSFYVLFLIGAFVTIKCGVCGVCCNWVPVPIS